jgi:hypothetical protein
MAPEDTRLLRAELEHYRTEKERVRQIVGQIGGQPSVGGGRLLNGVLLAVVVLLFVVDLARELFGLLSAYIPPLVLLEVAVFLLSLKLMWMIHLQMKLHHFQFWILNSLDFQVNDLSRRMRALEHGSPEGGAAARPAPRPRTAKRARSRSG